jgi:oleate hydratase
VRHLSQHFRVIAQLLRLSRFNFQPWHSAAEFRRCLRRYSYEFRSLNTKKILDCTRYNQYESIIVPIVRFLQNKGVDFRFRIKVTDIVIISDNDIESVAAINIVQNNSEEIINVCTNDIVIVSIGSVTSGSSSGSNTVPALPPSMEAVNELDENWSLWLDLGTKNPKFGNPYKFCTHVSESRLVTFTVTLNDAAGFFNRFLELTNGRPGSGSLVSLKHSNWMISLCIPHQPFFSDQPNNIDVLWGYGLYPSQEGNFVKMPMTLCNGKEIMAELLWHLDFPMEPILSNSITIPCVMPRMAAALLPRNSTDRPDVTPENVTNLAIVGQFVEIADETTVSLDYSVRGAQLALSRLMGIEGPPMRRRAFHTPFSYFWR